MNVIWLTALDMPKKERYSKEKQEKITAAAKGCRSITYFWKVRIWLYTDLPFNVPYCKTGFVNTDLSF